jgi:hypothetical protein
MDLCLLLPMDARSCRAAEAEARAALEDPESHDGELGAGPKVRALGCGGGGAGGAAIVLGMQWAQGAVRGWQGIVRALCYSREGLAYTSNGPHGVEKLAWGKNLAYTNLVFNGPPGAVDACLVYARRVNL